MPLSPGTKLGPYEIVEPLGQGGMGEVYRAIDPRLGREVAIKVLPERFEGDPESRQRLEQEARAASALNHPNIVTVYDIGTARDATYIAMELIGGANLRDLLAGAAMPLKKQLDVAGQVADGLAKAHAAGIVHRDLKPENVMVTQDGLVKILDFGLAKLSRTGERGEGDATTPDVGGLTEPGKLLGTVGYMSPEQAADRPIDFRSDQFALGSILYEMATGRRAFLKRSAVETLNAIINEEPTPVGTINPSVPAPFRWIVERCLAKDRGERYASTWDLARELRSLRDHLSEISGVRNAEPGARDAGVRQIVSSRGRGVWLLGGIAAGAALALAAVFLARPGARPVPTFEQITFRRGHLPSARFGPDGRTIVYAASWEGGPLEIATTRVGSAESRPLGLGPADLLALSRTEDIALLTDRRYVLGGTVNAGTLARISLSGGAPRELAKDVQQADWAPDGRDLAIVRDRAGRSRLEYPVGTVLYETGGWISNPRVSPNGDEVAFLDHPARGDDAGDVALVTRGGKKRAVSAGWGSAKGLAWSSGGDEIWVTAAKTGTARALYALTRSGRERLVLKITGTLTLQDVSPGGRVLICHDTERSGMVGRARDSAAERDLSWFDISSVADLSPDGTTVLFTEAGEAVGARYSVFMRKMDGSPAVRLGDGIARAFSPDGRWTLCTTTGPAPRQLQLLPTGAGEQRVVAADGIDHGAAIWLAGDRVLFSGNEPGRGSRLFVQDLAGGKPRAISPEGVSFFDSSASADGARVAATDGTRGVMLYPLDGSDARPVPAVQPGEVPVKWSADGNSILVYRGSEQPVGIVRIDLASGKREVVQRLTPPDAAGVVNVISIRMTSDGRAYAYSYIRILSELFVMTGLS